MCVCVSAAFGFDKFDRSAVSFKTRNRGQMRYGRVHFERTNENQIESSTVHYYYYCCCYLNRHYYDGSRSGRTIIGVFFIFILFYFIDSRLAGILL